MIEAFFKPALNGAIARVRQVAGEPQPLGILQMRDYAVEVGR